MKSEQAKSISLVDLLASLGHHPKYSKKNGNDLWYLSPLREEKTPSFKLKKSDNIWFDHGGGKGGNILDFVMALKNVNISGALAFLDNRDLSKTLCNQDHKKTIHTLKKVIEKGPDARKIIEIKPIYSYALKNYIAERAINYDLACKYLQELKYSYENKEYFALAFKNRLGGWELRSSTYKGVIGVKDITVFENNNDRVSIFEGFMDFLSYVTLKGNDTLNSDIIVLNSANMATYGIDFIKRKNYLEIYTFFNNDNAGNKAFESFKADIPRSTPFNYLYAGYNDLNEFLVKTKIKL